MRSKSLNLALESFRGKIRRTGIINRGPSPDFATNTPWARAELSWPSVSCCEIREVWVCMQSADQGLTAVM